MRRILLCILSLSFLSCFLFYAPGGVFQPVGGDENTTVIIQKGDSAFKTAHTFREKKLIPHSLGFLSAVGFLKLRGQPLKHGEYMVEAHITLWKLLQKIVNGDVIVHYLTIPEGLTVYEISKKIEDVPILTGTIEKLPPEGTLLPETYDYYWGDSRQQIMERMEKAMENLKIKVWKNAKIPFADWSDVLNLASIVEKETRLAKERNLVASVYLNRLKIGMPLQADPTIIYAATNGQTSFYRPIFKSDLKRESPYNTYKQKGLPPTPIACPGKASIMAVLKPAQTQYLYFVADGTGGHEFSTNLKDHNENVRNWRAIEKQKKGVL